MAQKGQITKHEWRSVYKTVAQDLKECIHCPVQRWEFIPRDRWGKRDIRYVLHGERLDKAPKCINRKITDNGDSTAT